MLKLEIDLHWRSETPLHIGSGALADSLADKPLIKDADGRPLVPGSAVRGKVRHACEQIARGLAPNWRWWDCRPPYQFCSDPANRCPACELFGTEAAPGQIQFSNLRLTLMRGLDVRGADEHLERASQTEVRWSVGLNRLRGTAEAELLYNVETHAPNAAIVYEGQVHGAVEGRGQAALLVAGLKAVRSLGGNRTRGLGWGQFDVAVRLDGKAEEAGSLAKEVSEWLASK